MSIMMKNIISKCITYNCIIGETICLKIKLNIMRKLAKKGGFMWVALAIIPIATLINEIGKAVHLDSNIIVVIQLPALALQLFSLFMIIRYRREIF